MSKSPGRHKLRTETAEALHSVVGFRLRRLHAVFQSKWQQALLGASQPVTQVQAGILLLIRENPQISQAALADLMHIEAPTLLEALRPLILQGLVVRVRSPLDRRAFCLTLSQLGEDTARFVDVLAIEHEDAVLSRLTASERRTLIALLDKALNTDPVKEAATGPVSADPAPQPRRRSV